MLPSFIIDKLQRPFYRPRDHRFVADYDDRAVEQARICNNCDDNLAFGRFHGEAEFLELLFLRPKQPECRNIQLCQQLFDVSLRQRVGKIINLLKINAVFTKQRRQISARRSGRFFVNSDFLYHRYLIPIL